MSSNMPFGVIEAVDPYPFHGLVYRNIGSNVDMLDPMDGRPAFPLPARISPVPRELHTYAPKVDGMLWDIGRPDPPVTPEILARGGSSLGKRLVEGSNLPTRLGDRTYQLRVDSYTSGGMLQLWWRRVDYTGTNVFATINEDEFGLDWATLADEGSGELIKDTYIGYETRPGFVTSQLDVSPDGTRRLVGVLCPGNLVGLVSARRGWDAFLVGIVEVTFSLDELGGIQASAQILRTSSQLMGTVTRSFSQSIKRLVGITDGYPICEQRFEPQEFPLELTGDLGTRHRLQQRTGRVIGALYTDDGIEYFTLDQRYETDLVASMSRPPRSTGTPIDPEEGAPYCEGPGEPLADAHQSVTDSVERSMTITFGGASISASTTWQQTTVASGDGGFSGDRTPVSGTRTTTITCSAGGARTNSVTIDRFETVEKRGFVDSPGVVYAPAPTLQVDSNYSIAIIQRRGWKSLLIVDGYSSPGTHDGWWLGMLTPAGVKGDTVAFPVRSVAGPAFLYGAAYNPMTGQYARECDMPDRTISGWI